MLYRHCFFVFCSYTVVTFVFSRAMEWTEKHDVLLCREILLEEPFKFRKSSNERGKIWTKISDTLNGYEEVRFRVGQRGVRERMDRLQTKYRARMKEEEAASGIAVDDVSELDTLISEIIDREKDAEEARESEGTLKKVKEDKQTAEEMRKAAMEKFGETRKRSEADDVGKHSKRRRSGSEAVEFLKAKAEMEREWRAEELALKRKDQEQAATRQAEVLQQQTGMLEAMHNMQRAMMQQQQQHTTAMMTLMERLLPKKS